MKRPKPLSEQLRDIVDAAGGPGVVAPMKREQPIAEQLRDIIDTPGAIAPLKSLKWWTRNGRVTTRRKKRVERQ